MAVMSEIDWQSDPSPVFAVNCCCVIPGMDIPVGDMVNAVSPGPPAAPGPLGRIAWAQPLSNTTTAVSINSTERFTVSPLLLHRLLVAHAHSVSSIGRFQLRLDWFENPTVVERLPLLTPRPD